MSAETSIRSLPASAIRRWRALRLRNRLALGFLTMLALSAGLSKIGRWWADTWPARSVLSDPTCVWPLAFSPDGRTLMTTGRDGIISWDVASGRKGETWASRSNGSPEMGTFSPDGKSFAAATFPYSGPPRIELYDAATGRRKATLTTDRRTIMHLAFAGDGRTLRAVLGDCPECQGHGARWNPACGYDLTEVLTWDIATGREVSSRLLTAPTRGAATAISPDGRTLALSDRVKTVQLWDLDADLTLGTLVNPANTRGLFGAGLGFSEDGRTLAIGRLDGALEFWDVPSRRLLRSIRSDTETFGFTTIRFSPDGRTLALAGSRGRQRSTLVKVEEAVLGALGSSPKVNWEFLLLDAATGRRLARAADSSRPFYSPDGRTLATYEPDGSTRLRDVPIR